jgi:dihydroorotate dehydrogenase
VDRSFIYEALLKPIFFQLNPESAHELSRALLDLADRIPFFFSGLEKAATYQTPRLETRVAGLNFLNPVGMAAGFDKTGELFPFLSRLGFGHVEIGTVTGEGQPGNSKPRLFRFPEQKALINRMGFNNPGAEKMLETIRKYSRRKSILGINAGKTKLVELENAPEDYAKSFRLLSPHSDYGVINISSPNTPGLRSLQGREEFRELFLNIKKHLGGSFSLPIFVKFAPDLSQTELENNLDECLKLNISGVILTNTTIDKSSLGLEKPEEGGLSGKPLRNKALEFTKIAYRILKGKIPIIGVGGIDSGESALERILAGANLVQIYTGYVFQGPFLPYEINKTIDLYLKKYSLDSVEQLVGQEND